MYCDDEKQLLAKLGEAGLELIRTSAADAIKGYTGKA
jgi:hypothetical protein